jgi:beta-glucosidase
MNPLSRRIVTIAAGAALTMAVAGGVVAGTQSADEEALAPARQAANASIEDKVAALVKQMTTKEKLEQVQLLADWQATDDEARAGLGGVFSEVNPAKINHLQHVAVEQSRLHIPIMFAFDTIHGYRTVFPIPLGAASSFDPSIAQADATIGARESATVGLKQVYSPMVDVSHEPRWGRISEGGGEDPYLGSAFAAARVKGDQGTDYSATDKVAASVKHFAAYGAPEGGREYNTTDMSQSALRNLYLPPFKAAVDAGADTAMCSFNAINGVPGCANHDTETQILKKEWGFDGFVESDYTAVAELRACPGVKPDGGPCGHGVAADGPSAGALALNAGTDSEMVSTNIRDYGEQLLAQHQISMSRLNDAVSRILRVKFRAGLFDHPYVDQTAATDEANFVTADDRTAARNAANESMVLLKNEGATLPFSDNKSTAVIGPLGNDKHDMLGPWWGHGRDEDAVSVFEGIHAQNPNSTFTKGCDTDNIDNAPDSHPDDACHNADIASVTAAANGAEQVVLALGETREMSGESAARSDIGLPGDEQKLIDAVAATHKPFVVVLFNGRPLTLGAAIPASPAILEAWFPGVEGGNAVADTVFGANNPGGKLSVSFPRVVGQVPIYYNHLPTGRPCDVTQKWNSRYRDLQSCAPQYPFGYGLSYTTFDVSNLTLDRTTVAKNGTVTVTVDLTNTGSVKGDDVVQLYIHDPVASISQPVRRLRGFQRVTLAPGETKKNITFHLDKSDFGFYDNSGNFVVEPGQIEVYAGDSSTADLSKSFTVQ